MVWEDDDLKEANEQFSFSELKQDKEVEDFNKQADEFDKEQEKITFVNSSSSDLEKYFKDTIKPIAFVTLFFSDTDCGKTYPSMTFPEPIYVIDTENRAILTKSYNFDNKAINIFEPVQFKTTFDEDNVDPFDSYKTIEQITKFIIDFANQVRQRKIKQGTLVIDSCTDIWTFIQDWGTIELSKRSNKKGARADNITGEITTQFDWKVPNKKHFELLGILRSLIKYGIFIVFTAREEKTPDYAQQQNKNPLLKDIIRAQKDVPFLADIIIQSVKRESQGQVKHYALIKKLRGLPVPTQMIENISYNKIIDLIKQQKEKVDKK